MFETKDKEYRERIHEDVQIEVQLYFAVKEKNKKASRREMKRKLRKLVRILPGLGWILDRMFIR